MTQISDIHHVRNYLDTLIQQGLQITGQNIAQLSEEHKERIYRQIRQLDISLAGVNLYGELERLYRKILKNIENKRTGWNEFKPNFVIRLGYSLLQQKRYEEGLAYILQGYRLDPHRIQEVFKEENDFDLFRDPARRTIFKKLSQLTIFDNGQPLFDEAKEFLASFDIEEQFLITEVVDKFELHSSLNKERDNLSSRRVLLSCLNQLCTFTEDTLRHNLILAGSIKKNDTTTLGSLIKKLAELDSHSLWKNFYDRAKDRIRNSPNYVQFNRNLRSIKSRSESNGSRSIAKYFLYLYCVRNFAGHHFEVKGRRSEFLFRSSDNRFKTSNVEVIFWSTFGSLWYAYMFFRRRTQGSTTAV